MKKKMLFFGLVTLALSSYAHSGGVDGGGGKSVVCRDADGKITSAEVLDLYEGRVQYGLQPIVSEDVVEEQTGKVVMMLSKGRGEALKNTLMSTVSYIMQEKVILPDGTELLPVDDSYHVVVPKNCRVEQLANFTSQNQVLINGEIWRRLDNTNKAALIIHEAIYKVFRMYGATNSIRARKATALGFSGGIFTPIWDGAPFWNGNSNMPYLNCKTAVSLPGSHFYAYNDDNGELVFHFDYLDGHLMLTKTILNIDKIPLDQLLNMNRDVNYWSTLISSMDMFTGVAISFKSKVENGISKSVMKIGFGNMPTVPTTEFYCTKI